MNLRFGHWIIRKEGVVDVVDEVDEVDEVDKMITLGPIRISKSYIQLLSS